MVDDMEVEVVVELELAPLETMELVVLVEGVVLVVLEVAVVLAV